MKLFEFTYNGCQAFIDVDEVIQVYASTEFKLKILYWKF